MSLYVNDTLVKDIMYIFHITYVYLQLFVDQLLAVFVGK